MGRSADGSWKNGFLKDEAVICKETAFNHGRLGVTVGDV